MCTVADSLDYVVQTRLTYQGNTFLECSNIRSTYKIVCVILKKLDAEVLTFTSYSSASATVYFQISSVIRIKFAHDIK